MQKYYLAIDIGASSGRHILGSVENGKIRLQEVWRFDNRQVRCGGHDCWDMDNLWQGIIDGMKECARIGKIPQTIGIDTWAVDFVLLDRNDQMIGDAVAYRDARTADADAEVEKTVSFEELYEKTGIQKQKFNTVYQLCALKKEHPEQLEKAEALLMIPDYFNFRLTGIKKQEYTNSTTTALVNAFSRQWDTELIRKLGLPDKLFGSLSMPGTEVGHLLPEIQDKVGYDAKVVLPATHDTASAFLAVPAKDENAVYLSSGTWSLLGIENEKPVTTSQSRMNNFTNEGGAWYRYRYLKNIMGLWMIQSVRRELNGTAYIEGRTSRYADGRNWSFPDLISEAERTESFASVADANDEMFLAPESMIDAVKEYCRKTDQKVPESVGEIVKCVYLSLSECYRKAIDELSELTGRKFTSINIVGGGCRDMYLNKMTAAAAGLTVYAGPVEGTAIGNLIIQFIASGEFEDLAAARRAVRSSFDIKEIKQTEE